MRSERGLQLVSNFRVTPTTSSTEKTYQVARFAPQFSNPFGSPIRSMERMRRHEPKQPNIHAPREAMSDALGIFLADASSIGLDLGQHNSHVRLLRVGGVGNGESADTPQLHPGWARLRINDGNGTNVQFRMSYEKQFMDGEGREWDKVVVRLEKARVQGHKVHLTPEMEREGFTFLSHNMPEILKEAHNGQNATATIRQETPDAACFYDGHHASAGRHELGCMCKEEREKSLEIIHARGGINSLMPGTGNGNGSEAQDIQIAVRNSVTRRGQTIRSYHEVYNRMGLTGDARNSSLAISTFILENLFQMQKVPNVTVLSESKSKKETWNTFGNHLVTGESLGVDMPDSVDALYKKRRFGYGNGTDTSAFPLQSR